MKFIKALAVFAVAGVLCASVAMAEDGKAKKSKFTPGSCCAKAEKKGEACAHPCCVEAAKAKTVCDKCNKKKE
jgi:hypothetical protein